MSTAQEINEERERLAELGLDPRRQWPPKMTWWKKDGTPLRNLRTDSYLRLLYLRKGFLPAPPSELAQAADEDTGSATTAALPPEPHPSGRQGGRPKGIPPRLFATVLQLHHQGHGYRWIDNHLRTLGVSTTFSTVRRLVRGEGAYGQARNIGGK